MNYASSFSFLTSNYLCFLVMEYGKHCIYLRSPVNAVDFLGFGYKNLYFKGKALNNYFFYK